jgi:hypothetical protein
MESNRYSKKFYDLQKLGSRQSARKVLPIVFNEISDIESAVDIGGGVGTWLRVAQELGATRIRLIDGAWVKKFELDVDPEYFIEHDLEQPLSLVCRERFDLAICCEVAEHLSPGRAVSLIRELTEISDSILFSAALPGQGGTNHQNEQWLSYWSHIFEEFNFGLVDLIRPIVWDDLDVEWWYAQNCVLFRKGLFATAVGPIDIVHPRAWSIHANSVLGWIGVKTGPLYEKLPVVLQGILSSVIRRS